MTTYYEFISKRITRFHNLLYRHRMGSNISVIGGGSWGTALAMIMAEKGYDVHLWVFEPDLVDTLNSTRENSLYLPEVKLPDGIRATNSIEEAVQDSELTLFVVPSHVARSILNQLAPVIRIDAPFVIATKGIENESLMLMSQVAEDVLPLECHSRLAVLSGPSFAKEVSAHQPTALDLASKDPDLLRRVRKILTTPYFKIFPKTDPIGVQLGGAMKNIFAIAVGCAEGLGLGHNARAAIMSQGLLEMIRLGTAMGADPNTFSGLSGFGDLVLTCTGHLSRNRTVGFKLGQGMKLQDITSEMKMVAEGIKTTTAAHQLAERFSISMPIVNEIHAILFETRDPHQALTHILEVPPDIDQST